MEGDKNEEKKTGECRDRRKGWDGGSTTRGGLSRKAAGRAVARKRFAGRSGEVRGVYTTWVRGIRSLTLIAARLGSRVYSYKEQRSH